MISIDLSIVRNVGVNIVLSSQILMLNICFYTIFRFVHYFNNTVLHCPPYICLLLRYFIWRNTVFSVFYLCNRVVFFCFFFSRPFHESFKFLKNCLYDFHEIFYSYSTPY